MNTSIVSTCKLSSTLSIYTCIAFLLAACGGAALDAGTVVATVQTSLAAFVESGGEAHSGSLMFEDVHAAELQTAPGNDTLDQGAAAQAGSDSDFRILGYTPGAADGAHPGTAPADPARSELPGNPIMPGTAARLYVSPAGADSNPGTVEKPFRSLERAARSARPGAVILVAPGTYAGGFRTMASGTVNARIYYVSTTKWGARIVPPEKSVNNTAWDNRGNHVDIVGFEIDGTTPQQGLAWMHGIYSGGSYTSIRNNHVHHIATTVTCTRAGGAAIGVDSYYKGVNAEVIGNLVHDIGPAGCSYVQGIYVSTSGSVKNNVVYRVAEAGIHLWHDANNVIITNNTITSSNTGIIVGGGDFYHTAGPNNYTAVYNNIVYGNKMGISEQGSTGVHNTYRNNLVYQNTIYNWRLKNGLTHSETVSAPPLFIAHPGDGTPDLKLRGSSPAIGRGTPTHAPSTDFEGRARNAETGYDIGAYQH